MELDDFEFKPLTKGLGFDKKAEKTQARPAVKAAHYPTRSAAPEKKDPGLFEKPADWKGLGTTTSSQVSRSISEMLESLPPSLDFLDDKKLKESKKKIYHPIGREDYLTDAVKEIIKPESEITPAEVEQMDVSLNNTLEKAFPQEGFRRPFFHQTVEIRPQFTTVPASFTSGILDLLVTSGLMTLFLVSLVFFTGVDLLAVVLHTQATTGVWLEIGGIYIGVYILYYLVARGLWGSTLGDWAFDIQLGTPEQRRHWSYPFQIMSRMVVIAATGFIVLPLLSYLFKKDLTYIFCGLRLHMKNY